MQQQKEKHEIVILGPAGVGKTQLLNRLVGKPYVAEYNITCEVELVPHNVSAERTINYRDAGADLKAGMIQRYVKDAAQIYLVFDGSKPDGLEKLKAYIEAKKFVFPETAKITLISTNKDFVIPEDLRDALTRQDSEADEYAKALTDSYPKELKGKYYRFSAIVENDYSTVVDALNGRTAEISIRPNMRPNPGKRGSFDGRDLFNKVVVGSSGNYSVGHKSDEDSTRTGEKDFIGDPVVPPAVLRHFDRQAAENKSQESAVPQSDQGGFASLLSFNASFALRLLGIALMVVGLVMLIYIALLAAGALGALTLTVVTNQFAAAVGSLVGVAAPTSIAAFGHACAAIGLSKTTVVGLLGSGVSLTMAGVGFRLFDKHSKMDAASEAPALSVTQQRA